ncbi:MAG: D-alanyl-D-alanine carboxypeptidase family protein [Clostridiales bacterium]|nr:D-alanyl-D-alanine carboxypeptidase family protein [Clostridiales bacterium]
MSEYKDDFEYEDTDTETTNNAASHPKKSKKKFKPNKEGMIALIELVLIILAVVLIIVMVIHAINNASHQSETTDKGSTQTTTLAETTETTTPAPSWMKNYKQISVDSTLRFEGYQVLVNENNKFTFPDSMVKGSSLADLYESRDTYYVLPQAKGYYINKNIVSYIQQVCSALKQEFSDYYANNKVMVRYAYRTYEDQEKIASSVSGASSAGCSDYHTGLSLFFYVYTSDGKIAELPTLQAEWLDENACKYGFVVRFESDKKEITGLTAEPGHVRFVDVVAATVMTRENLCLEEYVDMVKTHTEEPYECTVDRRDYYIYYVPADTTSTKTQISVPENGKQVDSFISQSGITSGMYTISGDNSSGFIVIIAK